MNIYQIIPAIEHQNDPRTIAIAVVVANDETTAIAIVGTEEDDYEANSAWVKRDAAIVVRVGSVSAAYLASLAQGVDHPHAIAIERKITHA